MTCDQAGPHAHDDDNDGDGDDHHHDHDLHEHPDYAGHGHSHGLVDRSILRSRDGVKTVSISLVILTFAAIAQTLVYVVSGSVARWSYSPRRSNV